MIIFLLVYLAIYGGLNACLWWKLTLAFGRHPLFQTILIVWLLLMVFGPFLVRMLESAHWIRLAQFVGMLAFTWMAVALWFDFIAVAGDVWNLLARLVARFQGGVLRGLIPPRPLAHAAILFAVICSVWGWFEAQRPRVVELNSKSPRLAAGSAPIRIAQVSDIHLGLINHERFLVKVVGIVRRLQPDLLVSTGDLVEGTAAHLNHLSAILKDVQPPLGKYAVTGNHEYYVGFRHSLAFTQDAGFRVLRGEAVAVRPDFYLAGLDDPTGSGRANNLEAETRALDATDSQAFVLLLKHRPEFAESSVGRFDLQLSGHAHGGQIFPFNWLVRLQYPLLEGLHAQGERSRLYISRGTGTWGPPFRLFAPPEVTLITLEPEQQAKPAGRGAE